MESVSAKSLSTVRIFSQIREIVERSSPQLMLITYEGHAWERMAFYVAHSATSHIQSVGYTHAPLFERQHAVRRPLGEKFNPDRIMTSGSIQKEQLECTKALNNTPIEVLGSKRVNTLQKDDTIEFKGTQKKQQEQKTCLVIPEGIESEIKMLFKFSLQCAMEFANLHFIWRLHPLFSFKNLVAKNNMYNSLPDNIELSEKSLEEVLRKHLPAAQVSALLKVEPADLDDGPDREELASRTFDDVMRRFKWQCLKLERDEAQRELQSTEKAGEDTTQLLEQKRRLSLLMRELELRK